MNHCLFWPTWCRLENVKWSNSRQFNPNFKIKTQKTHKQQSMRPLTCYKYFCQIYLFFWIFEYYGQLGAPGLGCATSFLDKMNMIFGISVKKICYIHVLVIFWKSFPPPIYKGKTIEQILRISGLHCIDYWLWTWYHEKIFYYTWKYIHWTNFS